MKEFIKVMKALADQNRIKIVKMLGQKEMCVCEIQAVLGLAQPTISKHLKILEDASLLEKRKDKLWVNYRLAENSASCYVNTMLANLNNWLTGDAEIDKLRSLAMTVSRQNLCNISSNK